MATATITLKTDTQANWESTNRILALNEPGLERVTINGVNYVNMKLGDGATAWNSLGYVFKLKEVEDTASSAASAVTSAQNYVTLAAAEYDKCVTEYNKTKAIADGIADDIDEAITNANNAAAACNGIAANLVGINDGESGYSTTYSSSKIEEMFKDVAINRPKEYGVRFSGSSASGTRLGDAVGLTAAVGIGTADAVNDFDYILPWKCKRVNGSYDENGVFTITATEGEPNFALDGSNGNVYVERPKFFYKYVFDTDYYEIWICTEQLDGYQIPPRFVNSDGTVIDVFYQPVYKMGTNSNGDPTSISGVNTMIGKSVASGLTHARRLGASYCIETTLDRQINELMFQVEFATRNVQNIMTGASSMAYNSTTDITSVETTSTNIAIVANSVASNYCVGQSIAIGTTKSGEDIASQRRITAIESYDSDNKAITFDGSAVSSIPVGSFLSSRCWFSGGTDSVVTPSGTPANDGRHQCRYRYVEDLWGNQWSWLGDVLIYDNKTYVCMGAGSSYVATDPRENTDYAAVSYTNSTTDGWVTELGYDANYPHVRITSAVGGSSTTYWSDYYWQASGLRGVRVGGALNDGANLGLWSFYCASAPSHTYWPIGCRLSNRV